MKKPTAEGVAFDLHVVGDETGETWAGQFRAKTKLSFQDSINIDRYRRELLGPGAEQAAAEVFSQAFIISELAYRLTETPEWWKEKKGGLLLSDTNVLEKVYQEATRIQEEARAAVKKEGEAARDALRGIKKSE